MAIPIDNAFQDMQAAVRTCMRKYADFSGRAGRPEFWWFFVAQLGAYVVASLLGGWLYYLVMLAPALGALVGSGVASLWTLYRRRGRAAGAAPPGRPTW